MAGHATPKSDFIFSDGAIPTKNVVLVVHLHDPTTLDVWMPRVITDTFDVEMRESLIEAITDFLRHVPVRRT